MLISIALRIVGDFLEPEEISVILGVSPHVAWRKGEVRITSSKKEIVSKHGLWEWGSDDPSHTLTINDHINRFRNAFEAVHHLFSSLPNVENAWLDIHFVVGDEKEPISEVWFLMEPETLSTLYKLGLPVEFTIDVLPPSEPIEDA